MTNSVLRSFIKMGAEKALHLFGLEKLAGKFDAVTHPIGRAVVRMNETPQRAGAIIKHYQDILAPTVVGRHPAGAVMNYYGEGKAPPLHVVGSSAYKPGQQPPSVKGKIVFETDRGLRAKTILSPHMATAPETTKLTTPRTPFVMPTDGLGRFPSSELPNLKGLLANPEQHEDFLRHLATEARAIGQEDLEKNPALAQTLTRFGIRLPR